MKLHHQLLTAAMLALPMAAQAADCAKGQVFTASGSCTVPAGMTRLFIHAHGGGGGGGKDSATEGAGGGGGGSYCGGPVTVTPGQTLTVTIGAGGAGATTNGASGIAGSDTEVTGSGISGLKALGGSGGGPEAGGAGGGTNFCTLTGAVKYAGGDGGESTSADQDAGAGGGGGSSFGGAGDAGIRAANGSTTGGAGGDGAASTALDRWGGNGGKGANATGVTKVGAGVSPGGGGGGASNTQQCVNTYPGDCSVDFAGRCDEELVQNVCAATCGSIDPAKGCTTTGGNGAPGVVVLQSFQVIAGGDAAAKKAEWLAAVAAEPACAGTTLITDDFPNPIPQAQSITFESGVESVNSDLLGTVLSGSLCINPGDPANSISDGCFHNRLETPAFPPPKLNSTTNTWYLLPKTCAFAFDEIGYDLLTSFGRKLGIQGNFDGSDQFVNIRTAINAGANGFFGVVGTVDDIANLLFQVATDYLPSSNNNNYGIGEALYAVRLYNVSASVVGGNGSVSCDPEKVLLGGSSTCTAVPDDGYRVLSWDGDCAATPDHNVQCYLSKIGKVDKGDKSSTVTFEPIPPNTYTVTATVASGQGGVSCSPGSVDTTGTASSTCTAVPEDGWQVSGWTGACFSAGTGTICNLTPVTGDRTSTVSFSKQTFSVAASVDGGNGSVSCDPTTVEFGATSTCTAVPNTGYQVKGWTDDCSSAGTSTHCILRQVAANQTATVSFSKITYSVSATVVGGNGSVSCNPTSVEFGAASTCTAVPNTGYQVAGWTGDCSSAGTSTQCSLTDIRANKTSTVSFKRVDPTPIPVLSFWGLGLLGLLLTSAAAWVRRR
jgi:hypothetical protein